MTALRFRREGEDSAVRSEVILFVSSGSVESGLIKRRSVVYKVKSIHHAFHLARDYNTAYYF